MWRDDHLMELDPIAAATEQDAARDTGSASTHSSSVDTIKPTRHTTQPHNTAAQHRRTESSKLT